MAKKKPAPNSTTAPAAAPAKHVDVIEPPRRLRFLDGRTGRHGAFGDAVEAGVYAVTRGGMKAAEASVEAGLAVWMDDITSNAGPAPGNQE